MRVLYKKRLFAILMIMILLLSQSIGTYGQNGENTAGINDSSETEAGDSQGGLSEFWYRSIGEQQLYDSDYLMGSPNKNAEALAVERKSLSETAADARKDGARDASGNGNRFLKIDNQENTVKRFLSSTDNSENMLSYTVSSLDELYLQIRNSLYNRETSLAITINGTYNNLSGEIDDMLGYIFNNDDYLYNSSYVDYTLSSYPGYYEVRFVFEYLLNKAQEDYVDARVKQILSSIITDNMNIYQKEKAIHDYIVVNVAEGTFEDGITAYSALISGKTICIGYALLAYRMFEEAGIRARIVNGTLGDYDYAWNMVRIAGNWYHIDLCGDDPYPDIPERVMYTYFNLSDNQMPTHYNWNLNFYPVANTIFVDMTSTDAVVNFPDVNLQGIIRSELKKSSTALIYRSDLLDMESLDATGLGISNIEGLQYLLNLQDLFLFNNQISSVDQLQGLSKLDSLGLDKNRISDISPLSSLTNLTWLSLSDNSISDINGLDALNKLEVLYLDNNIISRINAVSSLNSLYKLDLRSNVVSDLTALSGMYALTNLELIDNEIVDISPLCDLRALDTLSLGSNTISDLSPLGSLGAMKHLMLTHNNIEDIGPLSSLTELKTLFLSFNGIKDIRPLRGLTKLEYLFLDANEITNFTPVIGYYDRLQAKDFALNADTLTLGFTPAGSVAHPSLPVVYLSDMQNKRLYSVNIETKEMDYITFDLPPENITLTANKIYVALLKGRHDYTWWEKEQKGAIAVIDLDTFTLERQFDINIDPYQLLVEDDKYVYVVSGSGQFVPMKSYSLITGEEIGKSANVSMRSFAQFHPQLRRIYLLDTTSSGYSGFVDVLSVSDGRFNGYDLIRLSTIGTVVPFMPFTPDGKQAINGSGAVLSLSKDKNKDLLLKTRLNSRFSDITFDIENSRMYSIGGVDSCEIRQYNYYSNNQMDTYYTRYGISKVFTTGGWITAVTRTGQNSYQLEVILPGCEPVEDPFGIEAIIGLDTINIPTDGAAPSENRFSALIHDAEGNIVSDQQVNWSVLSIQSDLDFSADGVLRVNNNNDSEKITIIASLASYPGIVKAKTIQLYKTGAVAAGIAICGPDSLRSSGQGSYTAVIKDQYGQIMQGKKVIWSRNDRSRNIFLDADKGLIFVDADAQDSSIELKVTLEDNETISCTKQIPIIGKLDIVSNKYSANSAYTSIIKRDGSIWDIGNTTSSPQIIHVDANSEWDSVSRLTFSTYAIKSDGSLWGWGLNAVGIGSGQTGVNIPARIGTDYDWAAVAGTDSHVIAIKSDGTLWSWGNNSYGQLGDGSTVSRQKPGRITNFSDWISVSASRYQSFAIRSDGSLWAWGDNYYGQLGDGTNSNKPEPVRVGVENDWKAVSASSNYTIGLKADGSLWAWGKNDDGRLGDGSIINKLTPVRIGSDNDWNSINAGYYISATKTDGSIWVWQSSQSYNQTVRIPTKLSYGTGWVATNLQNGYLVAKRNDETYWMWGSFNPGGGGMINIPFISSTPQKIIDDTTVPSSKNKDTSLTSILVDGSGIPGFSPDNLQYNVVIPPDSVEVSGIIANAAAPTSRICISHSLQYPAFARIDVIAEDKGIKSYGMNLFTGDCNGDMKIDTDDLAAVALSYGSALADGNGRFNSKADLDGNGRIDIDDLMLLKQCYGR